METTTYNQSNGFEVLYSITSETPTSHDRTIGNRLLHEQSPINNQLILRTLFDLCPPKQLIPLRLVCKEYYTLSLNSWRSSLNIFFWDDIIYTNEDSISKTAGSIPTIRDFLNFVHDPTNDYQRKPITHFTLKEWDLKKKNMDFQEFFTTCGPHITHLTLLQPEFDNAETFHQKIFTTFPKLKALVLKTYQGRFWRRSRVPEGTEYEAPLEGELKSLKQLHIDMGDFQMQFPTSWLVLLSHFPNLDDIHLKNAGVDEVVKMLRAVQIIRKKHNLKLRLKHLNILLADMYFERNISPEVCELLHDLKLPLESLTMDFGAESCEAIVKDILDTHSDTLRKLNVCRAPKAIIYSDFPFGVSLNALQEITFSDRLSLNLHFLKYTPNLRRLSFFDPEKVDSTPIPDCEIVSSTSSTEMEGEMSQLTDLRFDYACSKDDVKNLTVWFPNVKKLRMPLDDEKFAIVCEMWKDLEDLEILGPEITDFGITGRYFPRKNDKRMTNIPANITHLTKLRVVIINTVYRIPSRLMDNSVFHGFLQCPSLRVLKIASQMGDEARNALYNKIPECSIKRFATYSKKVKNCDVRMGSILDWD